MPSKRTGFVSSVIFVCVTLFCWPKFAMAQSDYSLRSPDQRIEVKIHTVDRLAYDVLLNGAPVLQNCSLSMNINKITIGVRPKVIRARQSTVGQEIVSPVPQKSARIREHYNELRLEMETEYAVVFRAFNEGVSYRFAPSFPVKPKSARLTSKTGLISL